MSTKFLKLQLKGILSYYVKEKNNGIESLDLSNASVDINSFMREKYLVKSLCIITYWKTAIFKCIY